MDRTCDFCGNVLSEDKRRHAKYCNDVCRSKAHQEKIEKRKQLRRASLEQSGFAWIEQHPQIISAIKTWVVQDFDDGFNRLFIREYIYKAMRIYNVQINHNHTRAIAKHICDLDPRLKQAFKIRDKK